MNPLLQLAEEFRARATRIEAKHRKDTWVQSINVIEAFEQCAQDLETLHETLANRPQEQAPAETALRPVSPVQENNLNPS